MNMKIVLTGLVALVAFLWMFSYTTELSASELEQESSWKPILDKWSSNSLTLALLIVAVLLIGVLTKSVAITGISMGIVLVGVWMVWI